MAGENTVTTLDGLFKDVFGDHQMILPEGFRYQRDFSFRESKMLGDEFIENVLLAHEHGFTYAGSAEDAYTLNAAVAGVTKPAKVNGTQMSLRSRVGINAAHRAAKRGPAAFKRAFSVVVDNMMLSSRKRLELDLGYGQQGLGVVGSAVTGASGTITLTDATWMAGAWAGMEGAKIEVFDTTLASAQRGGDHTITAVNLDTKTITFDSVNGSVVAGDRLFFKGQYDFGTTTHKCMLGLHAILGSTGTLFNIAAGTYGLWKPSSYDVGSTALSFSKTNKGIVKAMNKGLDESLCFYISPNTWADLLDDEVALRRHPEGKAKRYDVGANGIEFHSQNGTILIKASNYVWEGSGYLIPKAYWSRIGATDVTFNRPTGGAGSDPTGTGRFFLWVQDAEAYELRVYSNQALYSPRPGLGVRFNNIVNAA